ncbi:PQQ-binding-like beta-propeller repeat protein [Lentisphaera marina]|uniref:outer membrane protein assembly factor BamB family protein n=1 Tax=Lentisphaera marina TaxID=1111041 RepID=UPI00236500F0|nr:PQQ-binding-like beta-propeller repeat protein [Lentisphaera marina]MDD7985394.1 PQQ-binding-like beta-propeller repeat protein [Lentisphaera marina]
MNDYKNSNEIALILVGGDLRNLWIKHISITIFVLLGLPLSAENWPMSGGPNGNWSIDTESSVPLQWSVRKSQNIKWRVELPEGGQGGIAIWGDRLFLCINPPIPDAEAAKMDPKKKNGGISADIILLCLNREDGKIIWQREIKGTMPAGYNYNFSDSTSICPVTDGEHVWGINASGGMACFDFEGKEIWSRTWMPTGGRPFNKQFDSILNVEFLLNVEPPGEGDQTRNKLWNYLRAIDKKTGEILWVSKEAVGHYNTPVFNYLNDGSPAVLMGRGGAHGVPEKPFGMTLISLKKNDVGQAMWSWEPEGDAKENRWGGLTNMHWNKLKAYWFVGKEKLFYTSVDTNSGKELSRSSLMKGDRYDYDEKKQEYIKTLDCSFDKQERQPYTSIVSCEYLFYMMRYEPYLVRHHIPSGKTEFLELPTEVLREQGKADQYLWKTKEKNDGLNSQGFAVSCDNRGRGDNFQKCFPGSPTKINQYLFFTLPLGLTYVVDSSEKDMKKSLISVNDLGPREQVFTLNSLSYSKGEIFLRNLKELICIKNN